MTDESKAASGVQSGPVQAQAPDESPATADTVRIRPGASSRDLALQVRDDGGKIVHAERLAARHTCELHIRPGQAIEIQYLTDENLAGLQAAIRANKA